MRTRKIHLALAVIAALLALFIFQAVRLIADTNPSGSAPEFAVPESGPVGGQCGTQIRFEQGLRARDIDPTAVSYACPVYGPCDQPETRDLWAYQSAGSVLTLRLAVHVLAHDDGTGLFATPDAIAAAIDSVNRHYAPAGIQFEYTLDEIHNSEWRALDDTEVEAMKLATAVDPSQNLNIWLTSTFFGYAFGVFPWDENCLGPLGGVVLGQWHWGDNQTGLAHEIGHCLGLWHPFHGVDEVDKCGPCYESVESTDRNILGDMCADTPPTPAWYQCSDAEGTDSCAGLPWGATQPENIMGYALPNCRNLFTPQQAARMRCWTTDVLAGWIASIGACCDGRVGDANGSGDDEPTIGDVSAMIDALFINGDWSSVPCLTEADVNQSGGLEPTIADVTIGDVSMLIDYLFIAGPENMTLPNCF